MIDIQIGDARNLIKEAEDKFFDCVMTSPPYWGLRDYGHDDQIGLEATPEEYLKTMLNLFDDIKLKLKDTGNCFVNIGDTFGSGSGGPSNICSLGINHALISRESSKPKCLLMIPERFAWGMIEHGWILRNKIIWHKSNHMPESVTDRLTKSYEVIYHFVKQQKYYYDLDAIREPHADSSMKRYSQPKPLIMGGNKYGKDDKLRIYSGNAWKPRAPRKNDDTEYGGNGSGIKNHSGNSLNHPLGKNPGDVWKIALQPYSEAHFAVFPIELVRRPILAGCPPGGHVLDPFGGSGTVAEFCRKNNRDCTIFELNPEYKELIKERSMSKYPELGAYSSDNKGCVSILEP